MREIQAGRSRDEHFHRLFSHYLPSTIHFFVNRGFSRQDAEDLAQDVLLSVYKSIGKFRFGASFDTYLFRILINVWNNAIRKQGTLEGQTEKVPLDAVVERAGADRPSRVVEPQDAAADPLQQALAKERTRLLSEALEQLPPKMRQYVLLRVGQGLKYREIADVMGVSMSTVKKQLVTAHQRLQTLLKEHIDVLVL